MYRAPLFVHLCFSQKAPLLAGHVRSCAAVRGALWRQYFFLAVNHMLCLGIVSKRREVQSIPCSDDQDHRFLLTDLI